LAKKLSLIEEYADSEYKRFLEEKGKYVDFDVFFRKEEI